MENQRFGGGGDLLQSFVLYGKGTGAAGFTGKSTKTPEEYADALLQLFERCRSVIRKG